jgi:dihydrofolate reductase
MGKVIMASAVSVDGFIADTGDRVGPLFDWYSNGDVPIEIGDTTYEFRTSPATAAYLTESWGRVGCVVIGRHLFDTTNGWSGRPAVGEHVFVVTHRAPTDWEYLDTAPFTFVTDGVASAIQKAKAFAGPDRDVALNAGEVGGQAFAAGLVDEVDLALVPVVFGSGVRFFGSFDEGPAMLENPTVVQGDRVTHLRYRVGKD